jgi:hypothetical protein
MADLPAPCLSFAHPVQELFRKHILGKIAPLANLILKDLAKSNILSQGTEEK